MMLAGRFGFVSAIVLAEIFKIQRHKVTEFLNRLIEESLLIKAPTQRAADGYVYVLTYSGAQYASELMRHEVFFRSASNPIEQINQNSIMHDTIMQFVLMAGIHNYTATGIHQPQWRGFVTEKEFRRLYPSNQVKNVDAVVLNADTSVAAIELEGSYKNKQKTEATLLKLTNCLFGENRLFDKVFFVTSSDKIFADTKRFHEQLLHELPNRYNKKTKLPLISADQAQALANLLIFRTKFTEKINQLFYG